MADRTKPTGSPDPHDDLFVPRDGDPITCEECGMLLARRWKDGGMVVVVKGEHFDAKGRIVVRCPNCGKQGAFYPHRYQAA